MNNRIDNKIRIIIASIGIIILVLYNLIYMEIIPYIEKERIIDEPYIYIGKLYKNMEYSYDGEIRTYDNINNKKIESDYILVDKGFEYPGFENYRKIDELGVKLIGLSNNFPYDSADLDVISEGFINYKTWEEIGFKNAALCGKININSDIPYFIKGTNPYSSGEYREELMKSSIIISFENILLKTNKSAIKNTGPTYEYRFDLYQKNDTTIAPPSLMYINKADDSSIEINSSLTKDAVSFDKCIKIFNLLIKLIVVIWAFSILLLVLQTCKRFAY